MRYNNFPTSCLYNELSTNGDEPKPTNFTPQRKGHLEILNSYILKFNNSYESYFYCINFIFASYCSISNPRNCFNNPWLVIENSLCKEDFIDPISSLKLHVIKMSSTYNTMTCNESPTCFKYTLGSYLHLSNPSDSLKFSILAYQALGDYLRP